MSHLNTYQRVKPKGALLAKVLAIGLVLVFFGCEQEPPPKAAPEVVRKKIQTPAAGKTHGEKTATAAKTAPSSSRQASKNAVAAAPAGKEEAKPASPAEKADAKAGDAQTTAAAQTTKQKPAPAGAPITAASASKQPEAAQAENVESPASDDEGSIQAPGLSPTATSLDIDAVAKRIGRKPPKVDTDPFEPLFKDEVPEKERLPKARPERKRRIPQTPLEKIDLGQLKLTAIIRTPAGNKALVEESSGKGYIIQKGTWIGVHAGRVQKITDEAVVVEEQIENAAGEISLTPRELKLQKTTGE